MGTIERKDPRFDRIVPHGAVLEVLAEGFAWVEGPVWNRRGGFLLFSDIPNNVVHKWKDGEGLSEFLKPSGYTGTVPFTGKEPGSNGLAYDGEGRLVLCQHGDRRVARLDGNGSFKTLVDRYDGQRLNSPNDLAFRSNGDLYFTDPAYGLPRQFDDPAREIAWNGVYRLGPDGRAVLLVRDMDVPNGLTFSPDERTLYVTDSSDRDRTRVMAFPVAADGTLGPGRLFADASRWAGHGPGVADGIKTDRSGNVFTTGPGGVHVLSREGDYLGAFITGVATANLNWGGDGSTLYITADTKLLRVRLTTKGW